MFENMTQIAFVFILLLIYIFSASDIQFLDGKNIFLTGIIKRQNNIYLYNYVI